VSWSLRLTSRLVHATRGWVLRAGAIVPGTPEADKFGTFGARSYFSYPPGALFGQQSIHVGEDTLIGAGTSLNVGYSPQETDLPARGLVIGNDCVIGAMATITAHASIVIGDGVWFGRDVFISDASHGYQDPDTPIGLQLGAKQPVSIGSGSWLGHGAIILPGATIGRNVVVGAGSVVRGVIPDHAVIAGVPARVVRLLEPGVGWAATNGSGDLRPTWTTAEVEAMLAGEIPPLF
jgi:serine acetyltransferase